MQIIIIGGGAAGLMAAVTAAEKGSAVTLLEQNEVFGKKILATGNGKCNLTNVNQRPEMYHSSLEEFPWQVISRFPLADTLRFFTGLGIYTKNRNGGLYPYSEQASAVRDVLCMEARHRKVKMKTREHVTAIRKENSRFLIDTETYTYQADRVILAAGGCASSVTGSCMDGFRLAESLGHTVVSPLPALTGLKGAGSYFSKWAGVRFDATVTLYENDRKLAAERGEIQFTEYGISGIPVFSVSRFAARALKAGSQVLAVLDFMPDFTEEQLTVFLESRLENCDYKTLEESFIGLLPQKLIPLLCTEIRYMPELANRLKNYPVIIKDTCAMSQAQVCTGGVSAEEICPETMESKLVPGLYFAGEVVDVDGSCGGYNLQWAWSSGAVAGKFCAGDTI
ncbi:MAG: aminoacetone oxidase family FAD-binding enzyme [Ruminococcus sp.]|jgi:predicted Rossmann fold flavoprotein